MPLPSQTKALVVHEYGQEPTIDSVPTPEAIPGSAVVKVLAVYCDPSLNDVLKPRNPYFSNPTPFIPGQSSIARVVAVGPDAVSVAPGQLVLIESFVRGRDNPQAQILTSIFSGPNTASQKLAKAENWRNGYLTEHARVPLENCYPLNEAALLGSVQDGGLGYQVTDLAVIPKQLVAYGGFRAIDLKAGETVIVAPATGMYSGAAVEVASAMGARVLAVGRNKEVLQRLAQSIPRVVPVELTGDTAKDTEILAKFGTIDAMMDFTPASVASPLYLDAGIGVISAGGRIVLMGFAYGNLTAPYAPMVLKRLTIRAQYMYERDDIRGLIKLIDLGILKLGKQAGRELVGNYALEEWKQAFESCRSTTWGKDVVISP